MLTTEQQQEFIRDGYLRVTDVFSDEQTRQLRSAMERLFDSPSAYEGDSDTGRSDIFCRYPELRWVLVHPPLVRVLKDLVGEDFVYIHEMSGHQNVFSNWHKDTTSIELRGNSFHWKPNFLMVECAIYLQDNDGRGGGLTVLPGSHNLYDRHKLRAQGAAIASGYAAPEPVGASRGGGVLGRLRQKFSAPAPPMPADPYYGLREVEVPGKAGDVVLFHFRIDHRGSEARLSRPADYRKLAIFIPFSANNEHVANYRAWQESRVDYLWLKNGHDYPADMRALIASHGLRLG